MTTNRVAYPLGAGLVSAAVSGIVLYIVYVIFGGMVPDHDIFVAILAGAWLAISVGIAAMAVAAAPRRRDR